MPLTVTLLLIVYETSVFLHMTIKIPGINGHCDFTKQENLRQNLNLQDKGRVIYCCNILSSRHLQNILLTLPEHVEQKMNRL